MSKHKIKLEDDCLASFSKALKKEINNNLKFYKRIDKEKAKEYQVAYSNVIFILKQKAEEFCIPLSDLGIEDYDVPKIEDDFDI
ncbi:hypothetical protein J7384_18590 [Endozoicomonas sp. G2_1]|uniref:hypothetical protein n=1 Tax=Endozoicomonas sp. G2_1 TaxID=2821091 RepID=UPI001ADB28B9|nr:hypothetical protein [Endozoicomonas sp. G2_1]MBO9492377.1 hypothetical protein [Endozoicomonas sp. G2_1]